MSFLSSLFNSCLKSGSLRVPVKSTALLLAVASISMSVRPAEAQRVRPNRPVRSEDGSVRVDNNARQIRTGPLRNGSNIPLPTGLPADTTNKVPIDVDRTRQAPNSIEIRSNVPYIEENFNRLINMGTTGNERYTLQQDSIRLTTTFELNQVRGQHDFAEGVQVTVISNGVRGESETVFVRGDEVTRGPGNARLGTSGLIEVTSNVEDVVEVRVLNIRSNGAEPTESAIYFTSNFSDEGNIGEFVVEDFLDGGDLDFDDGEYVEGVTGVGEAFTVRRNDNLTVTTRTEVVELPNFVDQATTTTEELIVGEPQTTTEDVELARERGQVEITDENPSNLLGHARGVRTDNDEQLVYSRYANALEARLGSDGLGVTGQLRPLINNPSAPPTLLTGNLRFDPFANDNQAGLTTTVGLTQYLTRTHRPAEDIFGNRVAQAGDSRSNLLVPTGLFNNRQIVGYVPTVATDPAADLLSAENGVFTPLPSRAVVIAPPDPQRVGRGQSAYTDNVGGLLIERVDGTLSFLPQWTKDGYEQSATTLSADEATRIIYALVPQQTGQNLQLGQTYAVTRSTSQYSIADGGFKIISADLQPQNFVQENAEIYTVEDTVAAVNAATAEFNGIQGIYTEVPGGEPVPTVDVADAAEADARVGNTISSTESPLLTGAQAFGQPGYLRTTRAGGLYLGGTLTGGLGNQEDTLLLSRTTTTSAVDRLRQQQIIETFSSPQSREDVISLTNGTTEEDTGTATFAINEAGELENVVFTPVTSVVTVTIDNEETRAAGEVVVGPRTLIETEITEETFADQPVREISSEQETITRTDTYPNFSAVLGELMIGGVYNFGNTPWTAAANTVRAEVFYRDTVFGRDSSDSDLGVRGEVVFHPFGEVKRDAYQVDAAGDVIPVYQTEPVVDADGNPVVETATSEAGESVAIALNQFVLDENGDRIAQRVGTGKARGPGAYLRVENVFDSGSGVEVAGGIQLSF